MALQILLRENVVPLRAEVCQHFQPLKSDPVRVLIPIERLVSVNEQVQQEPSESAITVITEKFVGFDRVIVAEPVQ